MNPVVTGLLGLLAKIVPAVAGNSTAVGSTISTITTLVPTLIQEYQDVLPFVKNIIATLKNDPATTAAQLAQLKALDKQVDDAFDTAAAAAQAEDSAG